MRETKQRIASLGDCKFYTQSLPPPTASTKTDADGKFTLKLRQNQRFALGAQASRDVGRSTEEYCWLVWTSLDGAMAKHVMLSNDKLWGRESEEMVVKGADLPVKPEQ